VPTPEFQELSDAANPLNHFGTDFVRTRNVDLHWRFGLQESWKDASKVRTRQIVRGLRGFGYTPESLIHAKADRVRSRGDRHRCPFANPPVEGLTVMALARGMDDILERRVSVSNLMHSAALVLSESM